MEAKEDINESAYLSGLHLRRRIRSARSALSRSHWHFCACSKPTSCSSRGPAVRVAIRMQVIDEGDGREAEGESRRRKSRLASLSPSHSPSTEGPPPKARRIQRACLQCRARKQRCRLTFSTSNVSVDQQDTAACWRCVQNGVACSFASEELSSQEVGQSSVSRMPYDVQARCIRLARAISHRL